MSDGGCPKRSESRPMDSKAQSLVLLNFFTSNPSQSWACSNNSAPLISRLNACYQASGNRWPNYIAVDFYMVLYVDWYMYMYTLATRACLNDQIKCTEEQRRRRSPGHRRRQRPPPVWPRQHHLLQAVFCSGTRIGFFTVSCPRRFSVVSWAGTWAC